MWVLVFDAEAWQVDLEAQPAPELPGQPSACRPGPEMTGAQRGAYREGGLRGAPSDRARSPRRRPATARHARDHAPAPPAVAAGRRRMSRTACIRTLPL